MKIKELCDILGKRIDDLSGRMKSLEIRTETQLNNHCGNHRVDKILNACYFFLTVIMFIILKWVWK